MTDYILNLQTGHSFKLLQHFKQVELWLHGIKTQSLTFT